MVEKYELAYHDYKAGMKQKEIAAKYDVSINTVKSWQQRKWKEMDNESADEKVCTPKKKSMHTKNEGASTKKSAATRSVNTDDEMVDIKIEEPGVVEDEPLIEGDFTDKQRLFISFYVKYWNAAKAYQKAYTCSRETALTNGPRLLRNAQIKEAVVRARDSLTEEVFLDKRVLLQKWMDIAFSDITDFMKFGHEEEIIYDDDGLPAVDANGNPRTYMRSYLHLTDSAEVDGTLITEVKQGRDGISVKLADKMKALEYLSKHFNLLSESEREKYLLAKAKADSEFAQIRVNKENGTQEDEYEDDGFIEALKGKEVTWDE